MAISTGQAELPSPEQIAADLSGPFSTSAAQPLLRERGPVAQRLEPLMQGQAAYLISTLKPWKETFGALSLTESKSGEHSIRPNAHTAYGLATLYRSVNDNYPEGLSPEICRDRAVSILRFVLPTHGAGGVECADGKHWKGQWQSALWAGRAGKAAWLLWDDLNPELRWMAARMVTEEADRFVGKTPPAQVEVDTKSEENAWNSTIISLAATMFPHHPHAAEWRKSASIWAASAFVREADLRQNPVIDGMRLKDVLAGPVIFDDYTLENHHRVHPDYMTCISLCAYQRHMYEWSGQPVPEGISFNLSKVWSVLKTVSMPDGGFVYPNGQDWQIHRSPHWIPTHAQEAVWNNNRRAALLMRFGIDAAEKMLAREPSLGLFLPEEYFFPSTQHDALDYLSDTYLLLRGWGDGPEPVSEEELWKEVSGPHLFESGKFALLRTPGSVSTFSWGPQVMGMVLPLKKDLLLNPNERGMIGMISVDGVKSEHPRIRTVKQASVKGGFGVAGIVDRAGGRVEQRFAFVALPDGRTVYVDNVRTTEPEKLRALDLGTIGVLNEGRWVYHDGDRTIFHDTGKRTFAATGEGDPEPVIFRSKWCNIDNMLGVVCLGPAPRQVYHPTTKPAHGRLEQLFHLNSVDLATVAESDKRDGAPQAQTALVFYPDQQHAMTRETASRTRLESDGPDKGRVIFEDGTRIVFDLQALGVSVEPGEDSAD